MRCVPAFDANSRGRDVSKISKDIAYASIRHQDPWDTVHKMKMK